MIARIRVLVVEDNPADADLVREYLPVAGPVSFQIESVSRLSEALAKLAHEGFDLILIDLGLPDSQGLATYYKLQKAAPDTPAIILTGQDDEETAVAAVRNGAQDYLIKGEIIGNMLVRAARYAVERKRADESLRESEENFRHSLDDSPLGVRIVTAEGETLYANRAILEIYGFGSLEEMRTTPLEKRYTAESYGEFKKRQEQRQQGEDSPSEHEVGIVRKDGEVRHLLVTRKRLLWNGKKQYQVLYSDITERKRSEEALQESEKKYRLLINTACESIVVAQGGLLTFVNPATISLLGYSERDLTGKPFSEFIHPDDRDMVIENYRRRIAKETVQSRYAFRVVTRDGVDKWVEINAVLIEWQGRPATLNFLTDITERRRAERMLESQHALLTALLNSSKDTIIFSLDRNYRYTAFNEKHREEMKHVWNADIKIGMDLLDCMQAPELRELARQSIDRALRGETFSEIQHQGEPDIYYEFSWNPILQHDEIVGATVFARDITERKLAENATQSALREKETLLREIHHRVKNNMQIISSLFNLQAGHIMDEEARRLLKEGQLRIRSMALIHEKLYKSRDLSTIDLASYIQSLLAYIIHFYKVDTRQIQLATDLEEVSLDINSAMPCGLLLNELISNALKHAFPGGRKGTVTIGLRREKDGTVELRIADDGVGIPEAMDFRATESLGLQIVNLLVEQLEGTIKLDKEKGTSFTVNFHELRYVPRI
jgi:PAS domain S-box-containing protein